jgi:hypothetical protein
MKSHDRNYVVKQCFRIFFGYVSCCFASGVLNAYPTLAEIFVANGVLNDGCEGSVAGKCDTQNDRLQLIYYIAGGATLVLYLFVGQAFDTLGPRGVAVVGAVGCAAWFLTMAAAVRWRAMQWSLWVSIPMVDLFGYLNSFALVGFIFHFPAWQVLLIGICNSSYNSSSAVLYLLAYMSKEMPLDYAFGVLSASALLSAVLAYFSIPTQEEYFACAEAAGNAPMTRMPFRPAHSFRDGLNVLSRRKLDNMVVFGAIFFAGTFLSFWTGSVFQYLNYVVGRAEANSLSITYSLVWALFGTLATPLTGLFYDFAQMNIFVWFCWTCMVVVLACSWSAIPSVIIVG